MGYFTGWLSHGDSGWYDIDGPRIVKISPATFSDDYEIARLTPIVVEITSTVGLASIGVTLGATVIYYGTPAGSFTTPYGRSTLVAVAGGYQLTFYPTLGWPSGPLSVVISAVDTSGLSASLTLAFSLTTSASPQDFRDSVWRWRRRLRRQKCSVISVAIDDNYSNGPGFVLTALSLELGKKRGLDRVPWRGGTTTNTHGSSDTGNGR